MTDPEYARLFRMRLQSALDLKRSNAGVELPGGPFVPPHAPSAAERGEWERLYFATNKAGERLVTVDAAHRAKCEALRDRVFGTARRNANGRAA